MLEPWLAEAVRSRTARFATQLRSLDSGSTPMPNLDWSVADLAQHVAGLPEFWDKQHEGGSHFERPDDFAAYSNAQRAHLTETDPAALADLVEHEFDGFVHRLDTGVQERWLYGVRTTPANMCGLALNELVLHGRDLAGITGSEPPMYERPEALAAVEAMMVTTPCFIDETKASAQPDGVYHVRFRGGPDYTWTKTGDSLSITSGKPAKADAHLVADPATFLLASLGRIGQVRAALSGKMLTYGKKPWRFVGLGTIAVDGV